MPNRKITMTGSQQYRNALIANAGKLEGFLSMKVNQLIAIFLLAALTCASRPARANVIVNFDLPQTNVHVGDMFSVEVRADLAFGMAGWGMLFHIQDPSVCHLTGPPLTAPPWWSTTTLTEEGWRLGGLAFPEPISGPGVLLATLNFKADTVGETDLVLSIDPNDLTQGFALAAPFPSGTFDIYTLNLGHVTVLDVPAPGVLAVFFCAGVGHRRRRS
jgi:hypothetical protein